MIRRTILGAALLAASALPASAHPDAAQHGSLMTGFSHPFSGLDHILAMIAVGLWAALIALRGSGNGTLWQLPAAFVGAMMLGFTAALAGMPLPFVEPVILASVVVLGLVVALAFPIPATAGMALAGFFAFFHGHAHGAEIGGAGMLGYAAGFAAATALLHLAGMAGGLGLGRSLEDNAARGITRLAGAAVAAGGVWLTIG
jgi:urease accessory protein